MLHALCLISQNLKLKPKRRLGVARGPAVALVARVLGTGSVAGAAYENDTRIASRSVWLHSVCFFEASIRFPDLTAFFFGDGR